MSANAKRILSDLWNDIERNLQKGELAEIAKNPHAHRDTRLMGDRGLRWRYWRAKNSKGQRVDFCYATTPNAAGYFLAWDEVTNTSKKTVERQNIRSYEKRKDAKESARNRAQRAGVL